MQDIYDFGSEFAQTYTANCECGRTVEVSAKLDEHPEYYASVYVRCACGKSVGFELPVN